MTRYRSLISIVVASGFVFGCKGETITKNDPNIEADLARCKKEKADIEEYKKKLEAANSQLMSKGSGMEYLVTIEGDLIKTVHAKIVNGNGGNYAGPPLDPKVLDAASLNFQNVVERSRGAIQKCYEQALKKNTGLQAKTVTLTVNATFATSGTFASSSFNPSLGSAFDTCMQAIASHWALPTNSPAMTFKAQVSLTPS